MIEIKYDAGTVMDFISPGDGTDATASRPTDAGIHSSEGEDIAVALWGVPVSKSGWDVDKITNADLLIMNLQGNNFNDLRDAIRSSD